MFFANNFSDPEVGIPALSHWDAGMVAGDVASSILRRSAIYFSLKNLNSVPLALRYRRLNTTLFFSSQSLSCDVSMF